MLRYSFRKTFKKLFRSMANIKLFGFIFAIIIIISVGFCEKSNAESESKYSYKTESFHTNIKVNSDYTYEVTETIKVDFTSPKHGIFRFIPVSLGKYKIKDIMVNGGLYDVDTDYKSNHKIFRIKIGEEDKYVKGEKTYKIRYRIVGIKDKKNSPDFLYLDLIPTNWDTPIEKVKVNISVPKEIDWTKASIYYGRYDSTQNVYDSSKFEVIPGYKNLTIIGKNLGANEGMTIKANLGKGYWVGARNYENRKFLVGLLFILVAIVFIFLWFLFGRSPEVVQTVEFYPPEGLTPLEIGYIIDGSVDDKDILSLIVYFANKGYLKIEESGKKNFKLTKLRKIDDDEKRFAKIFFNAVFSISDEVMTDKMPSDFADKAIVVEEMLIGFYSGKKRLFSKNSVLASWIMMIITIEMSLFLFGMLSMISGKILILIIGSIVSGLMCIWMFVASKLVNRSNSLSKWSKKVHLMVALLIIVLSELFMFTISLKYTGDKFMTLSVVISFPILSIISVNMKSRTKRSAELLGKILGFKNFIKTVELDKLKALVEEDPKYFYKILPYAYVLGLSDKWIKKFENIDLEPADWYFGNNYTMFGTIMYMDMMSKMNSSLENSMGSQIMNSSDTGYSSGGGGFSGGGFGGGGGGAW